MSARTGRWIFSMSGEGAPADAESDFATRDEAVNAAQAEYWTPADRQEIRDRDAKQKTQSKLTFYVGRVADARIVPVPAQEVLMALAEAQPQDSDAPPDWLQVNDAAANELAMLVNGAIGQWLVKHRLTPKWDVVKWELVEVPV